MDPNDKTGKALLLGFHIVMFILTVLLSIFIYKSLTPITSQFFIEDSNVTIYKVEDKTSILIESILNMKQIVTYSTQYSLRPISVNSKLAEVINIPQSSNKQLFDVGTNLVNDEVKLPPSLPKGKYLLQGYMIIHLSPLRDEKVKLVSAEINL